MSQAGWRGWLEREQPRFGRRGETLNREEGTATFELLEHLIPDPDVRDALLRMTHRP